jgi:hypothetical protein
MHEPDDPPVCDGVPVSDVPFPVMCNHILIEAYFALLYTRGLGIWITILKPGLASCRVSTALATGIPIRRSDPPLPRRGVDMPPLSPMSLGLPRLSLTGRCS